MNRQNILKHRSESKDLSKIMFCASNQSQDNSYFHSSQKKNRPINKNLFERFYNSSQYEAPTPIKQEQDSMQIEFLLQKTQILQMNLKMEKYKQLKVQNKILIQSEQQLKTQINDIEVKMTQLYQKIQQQLSIIDLNGKAFDREYTIKNEQIEVQEVRIKELLYDNKLMTKCVSDLQSRIQENAMNFIQVNETNLRLMETNKELSQTQSDMQKLNSILINESEHMNRIIQTNESNLEIFYKMIKQKENEIKLREQEIQYLFPKQVIKQVNRSNQEVQTEDDYDNSLIIEDRSLRGYQDENIGNEGLTGDLESLSNELNQVLWQKKLQMEMENISHLKKSQDKREKILTHKEDKIANFYKRLNEQHNIKL